MVATGVPKFTWKKISRYIMAGIVILIAVFVIFTYVGPVFGEFIEIPKKGEKARFVRYLSCAVAMCTAPNRQEGSNDGCTSDKVMELVVEYDDEGNPVKGCKQFCEELRDLAGGVPQEHYCGRDYAIEFTFRDSVKYIGNYSISMEAVLTGEGGPCSPWGMTGWQTDASCIGRWGTAGLIEFPCDQCRRGSEEDMVKIPDGTLLNYGDGDTCDTKGFEIPRDYNDFVGSLWLSDDYVTGINPNTGLPNCEDGGELGTLKRCDFNAGDTFWIWSVSNPQTALIWDVDWLFFKWKWAVFCPGPSFYECPKLVVCDHAP